ncbi:hypothetical protein EON80_05830 [bacterium]|nr:MAG: hypothetical protein EON80_05830 [bacterium]
MKNSKFRPSSSSGFGLVDVLVAIALLGISIAVFTQNSKQIMDRKYSGDLLRQKTILREMLLNSVSCERFTPCTGAREARILENRSRKVLVGLNKKPEYGNWRLEAFCKTDGNLEVIATAVQTTQKNNSNDDTSDDVNLGPSKSGDVLEDRLVSKKSDKSMRVLDADNKRAVLIEGGILCNKQVSTNPQVIIPPVVSDVCKYPRDKGKYEMCPFPERDGPEANKFRCCEKSLPFIPDCKVGKRYAKYWDRDGDWGTDGRWVVLCR